MMNLCAHCTDTQRTLLFCSSSSLLFKLNMLKKKHCCKTRHFAVSSCNRLPSLQQMIFLTLVSASDLKSILIPGLGLKIRSKLKSSCCDCGCWKINNFLSLWVLNALGAPCCCCCCFRECHLLALLFSWVQSSCFNECLLFWWVSGSRSVNLSGTRKIFSLVWQD